MTLETQAARTWFGAGCYWEESDKAIAWVYSNDDLSGPGVQRWIDNLRRDCPEARYGVVYDMRNGGLAMGGFVR